MVFPTIKIVASGKGWLVGDVLTVPETKWFCPMAKQGISNNTVIIFLAFMGRVVVFFEFFIGLGNPYVSLGGESMGQFGKIFGILGQLGGQAIHISIVQAK